MFTSTRAYTVHIPIRTMSNVLCEREYQCAQRIKRAYIYETFSNINRLREREQEARCGFTARARGFTTGAAEEDFYERDVTCAHTIGYMYTRSFIIIRVYLARIGTTRIEEERRNWVLFRGISRGGAKGSLVAAEG